MKKLVLTAAATLAVAAAATAVPGAAATSPQVPKTTDPASAYAIVQLAGRPLSTAATTRPQGGRHINFRSTAVKSRSAKLAAERNAFKTWLRANAPKAHVTREFNLALNGVAVRLNGTTLAKLRSAPDVRYVEPEQTFRALAHEDPDLSLSFVNEAWAQVGGSANAGRGVDVAIIDTGIDITHPCFDDAGYPAVNQIGDPAFTNNKVFVARVYGNKIAKNGDTPADIFGHGTHVAGTVACNAHTPANLDGVVIPYEPSGIAPAALLGNYKVLLGDAGSGRSEDIVNAMEDAYRDGFDVANMSLGGNRGSGGLLTAEAINNLDRANMVVAVAAGNEGPGYFTVHYPGAAARGLTAGASTVGQSIANLVSVDGVTVQSIVGDFGELTSDITAPLAVVPGTGFAHNLSTACTTDPALPDLTGKIALLGRGTCTFTEKMRNAQNAGAVAVIMVNRDASAPFVMGTTPPDPQPTIPGVMVSLADGALLDDHDGEATTINALGTYVTDPAITNKMADFSSQGPTLGDLLIKPDLVAPGVNILSAQPAWVCHTPPCWAFDQGTSMATPHLAGAAAVVRAAHPAWSAEQVRSAIVNTAQQGILRDPITDVVTDDPLIVGSGLLDVNAAVGASALLAPVSQSFGSWSSGAGGTRTATFVVTNPSASTKTFSATVSDTAVDGVAFSGASTFTLAPGAWTRITVTATSTKKTDDGNKWASLRISSGGVEVAHAMLFTLVGEGDRSPGSHEIPPPKQ